MLKLEVGKKYRSRCGTKIVTIMSIDTDRGVTYPCIGDNNWYYTLSGQWIKDTSARDPDLIEEVSESVIPETLQRIYDNSTKPEMKVDTSHIMQSFSGRIGEFDTNTEKYMKFHADICERMKAITKAKNADYTGEGDDPFANFKIVELNGITSTERGFLVRMSDKMARITSFVQKGTLEVKDESVQDTLMDLANYCILMMGYLNSKKDK